MILRFPGLNRHSVLLLNPVSVPFWNHIETAEWDYPEIRRQIVNVASLESLFILVVLVLEVHHSDEQALEVELTD